MTDVRLRAMTAEEFDAWSGGAIEEYAEDLVRNEKVAPDRARTQAAEEFVQLLPDGVATPDHRLYVAEDVSDDARIGLVWLGPRPREHDPSVAWVYDVEVEERSRGRGLGRRLMELIEDEARAEGKTRIELNVFGHNEIARNLYASMGYVEMTRQMGKDLV